MGGTLDVESVVGEGSTFTLRLELELGTPEAEVPPLDTDVLLVDDHAMARVALADALRAAGARVTAVATAEEALGHLDTGAPIGAAILDLDLGGSHLPGSHEGAVLAKTLRKRLPRLPLMLLAPVGARAPEPGLFDAVLSRPARRSRLIDLLQRLTSGASPDARRPEDALAPLAADLAILLVEDNPVNRKVALGLLRRLGGTADVAQNGREALEKMRARAYDIVLMDVQMPEMDGLEATRRLRAEHDHQPYVLALTANALSGDAEVCREAGMDAYLSKPVRLDHLADAFALFTAQPAGMTETASEASGSDAAQEMLARLREKTGVADLDFAADVLDAFLDSVGELADRLIDAALRQDGAALADVTHALKSACATLGADEVHDVCAAIEQSVREGRALEAIQMAPEAARAVRALTPIAEAALALAQGRSASETPTAPIEA